MSLSSVWCVLSVTYCQPEYLWSELEGQHSLWIQPWADFYYLYTMARDLHLVILMLVFQSLPIIFHSKIWRTLEELRRKWCVSISLECRLGIDTWWIGEATIKHSANTTNCPHHLQWVEVLGWKICFEGKTSIFSFRSPKLMKYNRILYLSW